MGSSGFYFRLRSSFRILTLLVITVLFAGLGFAQTPAAKIVAASSPTFDVVSVKPADLANPGMSIRFDPNRFAMGGCSLKFAIQYAYGIQDFQVVGGPDWVDSARFDIVAESENAFPRGGTNQQEQEARQKLLRQRLQALLADRFHLKVHISTKEMPVYGLVIAKGGSKLEKAKVETGGWSTGQGLIKGNYISMASLASMLSSTLDRIVLDQTGLPDKYDFALSWTPEDEPNPDPTLPGLFTAIQEQLGLKLEGQKGPVEVTVIDHVEKPSAN
jgi:uncharacterized protein (TIGR03435 family)